jgi:isopentenyl phosphate kinase
METVNKAVLHRLIKEAAASRQKVIVVSGSGNFGHHAVNKYGIDTMLGMAKVQLSAQKIGMRVLEEMLSVGMPTTLISPHMTWPRVGSAIVKALECGLTPLTYGDCLVDRKKAKIVSGELIINSLIKNLITAGWVVNRVVQVSCEEGVINSQGQVVRKINRMVWPKIKKFVGQAKTVDFTGGMLHKVEESLQLSKFGIETLILNGNKPGRLFDALTGKLVIGSYIV